MKKNKKYRPRRGLRIVGEVSSNRPAASFIGGSLTKVSPTKPKVNFSTKNFNLVTVTGSVMGYVQSNTSSLSFAQDASGLPVLTTSSISVRESISFGRQYEKRKYNSILLGNSATEPVGAKRYSAVTQDLNLTGSFESPSWTHSSVGFNQSFVANSLTSSYVETKSLNYYLSGTESVETTAVPASFPLFYSKSSRLQTITVKRKASAADTIVPYSGVLVPTTFAAGTGSLINIITGSNIAPHVSWADQPAMFQIDVPVSGKLVDIKVWLEVVHVSSSGKFFPLGMLIASLRSPNVRWGNAHAIRNDEDFIRSVKDVPGATAFYNPEILRNSYLLWEGTGFITSFGPTESGTSPSGSVDVARYPSWQKDRSMRTIFTDGSPTPNPRHLYSEMSPSGNYIGAPNSALSMNSAYGNNVPWTSDASVFPATGTYMAAGSPPKGWLSGPASTANSDEWPTTGSNYGAETIRPVYPLLDTVYCKKDIVDPLAFQAAQPLVGFPIYQDRWRGFRPGLRGTEISGTWTLMLANSSAFQLSTDAMDTYFRQVRLEITYESHSYTKPTKIRRSDNGASSIKPGPYQIFAISGTDAIGHPGIDYYKSRVFTDFPVDANIRRTYGIKLNTGSFSNSDYSLLYRLSGSLSEISGTAPGWLLNNRFGMPMIPESSSSLVEIVKQPIVSAPVADVLKLSSVFDSPKKLSDVVKSINPDKSIATLAINFVSGVLS